MLTSKATLFGQKGLQTCPSVCLPFPFAEMPTSLRFKLPVLSNAIIIAGESVAPENVISLGHLRYFVLSARVIAS